MFHETCLNEWFKTGDGSKAKCPTCSTPFSKTVPSKTPNSSSSENKSGSNSPQASGSSHGNVPELDEIYTSILFDELNSDILDSEEEPEACCSGIQESSEVSTHLEHECQKEITLKQVLQDLSKSINKDETSHFNISCNHLWEGSKRALNRKSFSPNKKVSIKFTDDIGKFEGAVDLGGPAREYFTLATEWLVNSQLFVGGATSKFLSRNAQCLEEREYFMAGQIFAMFLLHGGPAMKCLSEGCYTALIDGIQNESAPIKDVHEYELQSSLEKLVHAQTLQETTKIIEDEKVDTVLDMAGTLRAFRTIEDVKNDVQKTVNWYVLYRAQPAYDAFKEGLSACGVFESMKKHPKIFKEAFCYEAHTLGANEFGQLFTTERDNEGSNRRDIESQVLCHWHDFLQDCEEDDEMDLSEVLFFASGCRKIPPNGLFKLAFLHEPELNGLLSKYPKANTCSYILHLPVVHEKYDEFKASMIFAIKNCRGFGMASEDGFYPNTAIKLFLKPAFFFFFLQCSILY